MVTKFVEYYIVLLQVLNTKSYTLAVIMFRIYLYLMNLKKHIGKKYVTNCKGICKNYKVVKEKNSFSYYLNGFKRCNECEIFIDWNSYKCPCCNNILRIKPHNTTCKTRILKEYVYM